MLGRSSIARKSEHGVPTGVSSRSNTSPGAAAATSPPPPLELRRRAEVRSAARPAASPEEASTAMAHSRNTSCFMVRQQRQRRWRQRASQEEQTSRRLGAAAKPNREGCYGLVGDVTAVKPELRSFAHQITLKPFLPFPKKARSGGQIVEKFWCAGREKNWGGQIVRKK
uniref:Uncharacterized protein n=1 Tax=Rhipicephalus zambeziensis TaxID=60191 RepID=A0A224Y6J1_9ACAR